jgi:hypothetical protein
MCTYPITNPVGRPRERDRAKIAEDLIEWAKKDDSINVNKFCAWYDPPFPTSKLSQWSKEDEEFRQSYEITKAFIAYRREEKLNSGQLHVKAYDLNAGAYDYMVQEERNRQVEFEVKAKSQTESQADEKIIDNFERTMKQLERLQSSARKTDESNINKEQKSA